MADIPSVPADDTLHPQQLVEIDEFLEDL
jgi:hypothetical protein